MNDNIFFKFFRFNEFQHAETVHRDNSRGIDFHFVGLIKQGKGRLVSQGKVLELAVGDMFYIPKGCSYHSYWIAEPQVRFDSIGFLYFPSKATGGYALQKIDRDADIEALFMPLSQDKTLNTASIGQLYLLLGALEERLMPASVKKDVLVAEQLLHEMERDPHRSIPEYAFLCGVSESALYGYTKSVFGKTPNRLRQETLCRKAYGLLTSSDYSIETLCDRLGFSSAAYFRRVYAEIYGQSPSQTRKQSRHI